MGKMPNLNMLDATPAELEYGVIYVFTNLYAPQSLLNNYRTAIGRAVGQSEALNRFDVQVVYVDRQPMLVARRFNAGNIGHTAVVTCPVCGDIAIDGKLVEEFSRKLFDFAQLDTGDLQINIADFLTPAEQVQMQEAIDDPDLSAKLENAQLRAESEDAQPVASDTADAEGRALAEAEHAREQYLALVGQLVTNYVSLTHRDPQPLLGNTLTATTSLIFGPQDLSRLEIDGDLRIWLIDYGHAEIRLHPLSKALYILFLRHPEGIELRNIDAHRDELEQIYDIIMPGRDIDTGDSIIHNVLNPLSGTLLQNLSRIKRFVKTVIMDDEVARQYYVAGRRGEAYRIALPRHLAALPRVFDEID